MAKLCVCLETVFRDLPFLERIDRIADLGYEVMEFWSLNPKDPGRKPEAIAKRCQARGITVSDFVLSSPDGSSDICASFLNVFFFMAWRRFLSVSQPLYPVSASFPVR